MKLSSWSTLLLAPGLSLATTANPTGSVIAKENATTTVSNGSSVPNPSAFATTVSIDLKRESHFLPTSIPGMLIARQNTGISSSALCRQRLSTPPSRQHRSPRANWSLRPLCTIRLSHRVSKMPWPPRTRAGSSLLDSTGAWRRRRTRLKARRKLRGEGLRFGMCSRTGQLI